MSVAFTLIFKQVPRRASNVYYAPPPEILRDVPNPPTAPVVHIDAIDLTRIMATVMAERERCRKPEISSSMQRSAGLTTFLEHWTQD